MLFRSRADVILLRATLAQVDFTSASSSDNVPNPNSAPTPAAGLPNPNPNSRPSAVFAALEVERAARTNAEESRVATGKYLAEQIEAVSKQKLALEAALGGFTHGREFWKAKAIAALERCEALEAENVRVKRELAVFAKKQAVVVERQVSDILQEVAEERERLMQLEELDPPSFKYASPVPEPSRSSLAEVSYYKCWPFA